MIPPFLGLEMEIHEYFHLCESEIGDTSCPWELLKLKVSKRGQKSCILFLWCETYIRFTARAQVYNGAILNLNSKIQTYYFLSKMCHSFFSQIR